MWGSLPGGDLGHDFVGDRADELGRNLSAVLLLQKALDLTHGHAPGVHRNDLVIKAGETPFVFGDQYGRETAVSVARNLDTQGAVLGQNCRHPCRYVGW